MALVTTHGHNVHGRPGTLRERKIENGGRERNKRRKRKDERSSSEILFLPDVISLEPGHVTSQETQLTVWGNDSMRAVRYT